MSLDEASLQLDVRTRLFAPSASALTIGAELELIPVIAATKRPAPIQSSSGPSLVAMLRAVAGTERWKEVTGLSTVPSWRLPDESRISFEPGGQIEISSRPHDSCSGLISSLQKTADCLSAAAGQTGIELLAVGADPFNDISDVPLQLGDDRYLRMTRYMEARGGFGVRMMRQTAALQISVEHGPDPVARWTLLNSLAPYVIAIFANSSRYAGRDTRHASYRAHFWRELDDSRTGIPFSASDPASRYAEFALGAGALRTDNDRGEFHEFRSLLAEPKLAEEDWQFHLSTLFPEIRPKEFFEIRSADTIQAADISAPLAFVAGLVYDDAAAVAAQALVGVPNDKLLRDAGQYGLRDERIRDTAAELVRIAMAGAARLPPEYLTPRHREHAAAWFERRIDRTHAESIV
jgi:glutamate--cysteine ligase